MDDAELAQLAFFDAEGEHLLPRDTARSGWGETIHGVATSGALARTVEAELDHAGRADLRPARCTVDLFRPAAMQPCRVEASIVREGPRLCLVDARLVQGDTTVARSSTLFLKATEDPPGEIWSPAGHPEPPPTDLVPPTLEPTVPWVHSPEVGWSQDFGAHQDGGRKRIWQCITPVVAGEPLTPFVSLAAVADSTSMVTNWSSAGVNYINTDISFSVSRLPETIEVGLEASDHTAYDGIAVGTATLFDRRGRFGTATVTALANARRTVDLSGLADAASATA